MNMQEAFTKVVNHLRKQNAKAFRVPGDERSGCAYRSPDGKQCGAGCLIPDDEYNLDFERLSIGASSVIGAIPSLREFQTTKGVGFLRRIQEVHDHKDIDQWEESLQLVARDYHLTMP